MKRNFIRTFQVLSFILCLVLTVGILYYLFFNRRMSADYEPVAYTESSVLLDNPYCGFYQMNGYTLSDTATTSNASEWGKQRCQKDPYQLMLLEINLKNYSNKSLSQNALNQLDQILTECETAKKQIILRFLYDWDGNATATEPTDFSRIKDHIKQVAGTVNKHKDTVYILQGVFTGNNGEMHGTNYGDPDQVRQLMEVLSDVTDNSIYLSVRTPAHLRSILRNKTALSATEAYSGTLASRLGLYNDGMLGSVYDLGTYDDTPFEDPSDFSEKGTRDEELRFQDTLCQYVPNGGEVTINNTYNDLENAVSDLATMHVSYLNADHDTAVLDKWKKSTYIKDTTFPDTNGYDYIQAHLGYRYVLQDSHFDFHSFAGDSSTFYLIIANTGFAPAYREFTTTLTVTNKDTNDSFKIENNIDNREITSQDSSIFTTDFDIRPLDNGTYEISLSMQDPATGQPIYFANTGYEDQDTLPLGTLTIQKNRLPLPSFIKPFVHKVVDSFSQIDQIIKSLLTQNSK